MPFVNTFLLAAIGRLILPKIISLHSDFLIKVSQNPNEYEMSRTVY